MSGLFDLLFLALVVWWIFRSLGQTMGGEGGEGGEGRSPGGFDLEDILRGRTGTREEPPTRQGPERATTSGPEGGAGAGESGGERERLMASIRDELAKWNQTRREGDEADDRPGWVRRAEARMGQLTRERELAEAAERELQVGEPSESWRLEEVQRPGEGRESPIRSVRDVSAPLEERSVRPSPTKRRPVVSRPLAAGEIGTDGFPEAVETDPGAGARPVRPVRPVRPGREARRAELPAFTQRSALERAILYREILGPPRALSPWKGTDHGEA